MANGLPRESIEYYTGLGQRILVELNPNILVRDAIIMYNVDSADSCITVYFLSLAALSGPGASIHKEWPTPLVHLTWRLQQNADL